MCKYYHFQYSFPLPVFELNYFNALNLFHIQLIIYECDNMPYWPYSYILCCVFMLFSYYTCFSTLFLFILHFIIITLMSAKLSWGRTNLQRDKWGASHLFKISKTADFRIVNERFCIYKVENERADYFLRK